MRQQIGGNCRPKYFYPERHIDTLVVSLRNSWILFAKEFHGEVGVGPAKVISG
jgi:hypothetical protein